MIGHGTGKIILKFPPESQQSITGGPWLTQILCPWQFT